MSTISRLAKPVLLGGSKIVWKYLTFFKRISFHLDRYDPQLIHDKTKKLFHYVLDKLDVELIIEGQENIPNETFYLYSNHNGTMDPVLLTTCFDKPIAFAAKKEISKYPFIATILKDQGGLFLDRDDLRQQLKVMKLIEEELIKGERNFCIFPEGTRNKDANRLLNDFHNGSLRPAMKTKTPILPVIILGSDRILKGNPKYNKYPVHIKFLKPLYYDDYKNIKGEELNKILKEEMESSIAFDLRKKDHQKMMELNKDKYHRL